MKLLTIACAVGAVFLASIAAYVSVTGIAELFGGSLVILMLASAIEFSKLIIAGLVYRLRNKLSSIGKFGWYSALGILMLITSAGIYGYLMNTYQSSEAPLTMIETKIAKLEVDKNALLENKQILLANMQNYSANLEKELDSLVITRNTRFLDNKKRKETIELYQPFINEFRDEITIVDSTLTIINGQIGKLKLNLINSQSKIGPILYIAKTYNIDGRVVVNIFMILLVLVGDPVAVGLVIGYHRLSEMDEKNEVIVKYESKSESENEGKGITPEKSSIGIAESEFKTFLKPHEIENAILNADIIPANEHIDESSDTVNPIEVPDLSIPTDEMALLVENNENTGSMSPDEIAQYVNAVHAEASNEKRSKTVRYVPGGGIVAR